MSGNWKLGLYYPLITIVMWGALPLALKGLMTTMDPITLLALAGLLSNYLLYCLRPKLYHR